MASIFAQGVKLSHKQFRAMLKKFRRKKKRQQLAKEREQLELLEQQRRENSPNYKEREAERLRNSELYEQFEERERIRQHKLWLLREEKAQTEFKKKQEQLELEKQRREEERKRILAEFEKQQFLENQVLEENKKIKSEKEEALQEALSNLPEGDGPWHNPIAPENYSLGKEREQCQFFAKTGCCRFGERCSRGHIHPPISCTILIKGMYSHFSIDQTGRDDYDTDIALEYEDKERYQDFENFYWDVLPEFKKFGKVVQFKVCSNHEPHLRGNVYVQYSKEEEALEAYKNFNGRYYAGKQITCEFTHVIKWRSAICGLYERHLCPKGINCNFLHVFRNPSNEFWEADRDLPGRPKDRISVSSRSNHSRSKEEKAYSHHGHRSERHRRHRDQSPDQNNDRHSKASSYRHDRDIDSDKYDNDHYGSSRHKYSDRNGDSYRSKHYSSKNRNSRSRSRSLSYSSSEDEKYKAERRRKHKKKKSKKAKKRSSCEREDD